MGLSKAINIFNFFKPKLKSVTHIPSKVWQDPLYFIGFGFGSGTISFAPGTWGTLMAIPFYLFFRPLPLLSYFLLVILFIFVSSWICDYLSQEINIHDHPGMNIDEFAGFFVTMINAPQTWEYILLGFVLFRFFDICKPWPIRQLDEKVKSGFGMVLDDVVAGFFSMMIIQIIKNFAY